MRRLFIDIETAPSSAKPDPSEIKAPANYKNPETIRNYQESAVDDAWRAQSLESLKGQVVCVGMAWDDGLPFACTGAEQEIMEKVAAFVGSEAILPEIVGFNVRTFDLLWLRHRAYKYGLASLVNALPWQRYDKRVVDLREIWTGGDSRMKGTLNEICKWLGIGEKSGDGSEVFDMWQAGKTAEIAAYCCQDVELTRGLWRVMFPKEAKFLGGYVSSRRDFVPTEEDHLKAQAI